jgi:hypothetical protein
LAGSGEFYVRNQNVIGGCRFRCSAGLGISAPAGDRGNVDPTDAGIFSNEDFAPRTAGKFTVTVFDPLLMFGEV